MSRTVPLSALFTVLWILLALAILGGMVWGNTVFSRNFSGEKDFLVPWLAARTFLEYGDSPYSDSASQRAQIVHYGRIADESEDALFLWFPFPAELFYFPLALIQDYNLAHGLWLTLSEVAFISACLLLLHLIGWKLTRSFLVFVLLFAVLWAFSLFNLLESGPFPFAFLALIGSLLYLRSGQDELAGVLLVFPFLMIGTFGVAMVFFTWWVLYHRRWRVIAGLGMASGILLLISFLLMPDWIMPFIRGIYWHGLSNPGLSTFGIMGDIWPVVGPRLGWITTGLLLLVLLVEWRNARRRHFNHLLWTICLTFSATPLLGLPFYLSSLSILVIPIFLFLFILGERWSRKKLGGPAGIAFVLIWFFSWGIALFSNMRPAIILPMVLLVGLYWMRWWITRPPRTVLESMR